MDGNLVYEKTLAGDEATRNRTRLVQRNLRMILVLVDGVSNISELVVKAGNSQIVYAALKELEAGGFITLASRKNSTAAKPVKKAEKTAQSDQKPGFSHFSEFSTFGAGAISKKTKPAQTLQIPIGAPTKPELSVIDVSPVGGSNNMDTLRIEPTAEMQKNSESSAFGTTLPPRSSSSSKRSKSSSKKDKDKETIKIKPIRRNQKARATISWPLALLYGMIGLIVLAVLTAFFFPYSYFRSDFETAFSQALGRSVTIGDIQVEFSSRPLLTLNQVKMGGGKSELAASSISFKPSLAMLLFSTQTLPPVEVKGVQLKTDQLPLLRDAMKSLAISPYVPKAIKLTDFTLSGKDFSFASLHGNVDISPGSFKEVSLGTENDTLSFTLMPQKDKTLGIKIEGRDWQPLASNPDFKLDFFHAEGSMDNEHIDFKRLDLHLWNGGVAKGTLTLDLADKIIVASGQMNYEQINAKKLMELFKTGFNITGDMKGQIRISSSAEKWNDLYRQSMIDGTVTVLRGEIIGIDFERAMRRIQAAGGSTRFEQINGDIAIDETSAVRLSHLNVASGLMTAEGDALINPKKELSGQLAIALKSSANLVKTPAQLAGTLKKPQLVIN